MEAFDRLLEIGVAKLHPHAFPCCATSCEILRIERKQNPLKMSPKFNAHGIFPSNKCIKPASGTLIKCIIVYTLSLGFEYTK